MNPQIIQPTPDAALPDNTQPVARPIVYAQQPASYQPKDMHPAEIARPTPEQTSVAQTPAALQPTPIISRPVAPVTPVTTIQRTIIKGTDEESTLLKHGKVEFNIKPVLRHKHNKAQAIDDYGF